MRGKLDDPKLSAHLKKTIEDCLREGFVPFRHRPQPGELGSSSLREAARRTNVPVNTINSWVMRQVDKKEAGQPNYCPDWSLWKQPEAAAPAPVPTPEPIDLRHQIEIDRARLREHDIAAENKRLREALIEAQDIRAGVLKLVDPPLRPTMDAAKKIKRTGQRTVIIHLSDWHCGERVDIDEMEGVNSYSMDVFRRRVARLGASAVDLMTTHWKGQPPEKIILIFGGDMITGEIHDELAKTNDALSAPAVRECAERLAGLVKTLRAIAPIDIYSIPGNHGRLTKKPESKGMAVNSFDTLISHVVEMVVTLGGARDIRFFYPKSGDAIFTVYGLTICAAHGDRIGSRGGQGFIGPIATILRGVAKTRSYYAAQGIILDYVMCGHFHTTSKLPRAFSNGSLVGPSEYSRDLKADPEVAKQNLVVIHSENGVIAFEELFCGDASEGSIYRSRAS